MAKVYGGYATQINLLACLINIEHQNLNKLLMSSPIFIQKKQRFSFQINETSLGCFFQVEISRFNWEVKSRKQVLINPRIKKNKLDEEIMR
ncbi:hypothetical protein IMY05_016G0050000 [Salix suchowensis]|nr:hypothetical protein IMY05_016G0050000 [Salix suchowensis]